MDSFLVVLWNESQNRIIVYAGRRGMAAWRNRAPTRRYADCVKDVTRSSHLQPTPFVMSKLHSTHEIRHDRHASEFPCAVVVSVITSGTYTRERLTGQSAMTLTLRSCPDCRSGDQITRTITIQSGARLWSAIKLEKRVFANSKLQCETS